MKTRVVLQRGSGYFLVQEYVGWFTGWRPCELRTHGKLTNYALFPQLQQAISFAKIPKEKIVYSTPKFRVVIERGESSFVLQTSSPWTGSWYYEGEIYFDLIQDAVDYARTPKIKVLWRND